MNLTRYNETGDKTHVLENNENLMLYFYASTSSTESKKSFVLDEQNSIDSENTTSAAILIKKYTNSGDSYKLVAEDETVYDEMGDCILERNTTYYYNARNERFTYNETLKTLVKNKKGQPIESKNTSFGTEEIETWSYNVDGNLLEHLKDGVINEKNIYDSKGNLEAYTYYDGKLYTMLSYDSNGNLISKKAWGDHMIIRHIL